MFLYKLIHKNHCFTICFGFPWSFVFRIDVKLNRFSRPSRDLTANDLLNFPFSPWDLTNWSEDLFVEGGDFLVTVSCTPEFCRMISLGFRSSTCSLSSILSLGLPALMFDVCSKWRLVADDVSQAHLILPHSWQRNLSSCKQ